MRGLYSRRSTFMSYKIPLCVFTDIYLCITLPITYTLGGGETKAYFIIVQPNFARHLVLLGIIGFTILPQCGYINP